MLDKLMKLLKIKFAGELILKDGTVLVIDGDLAVGARVQVQSPDGLMDLPSGDYEIQSGEIISVIDGKIENITDVVDTTEAPDINGAPPVGEVSVEVDAVAPEEIIEAPIAEENAPDAIEEFRNKLDSVIARLDALEAATGLSKQVETEMKAELDFIKSKTLVTELKKSKEVEDKPLTRMDIIKNLKNK